MIPPGGILSKSTGALGYGYMEMKHDTHYWRFGLMAVLHCLAMYILMYAMVDIVANAHPNHNQFYMALLMTAPMLILEIWLMGAMYPKKKVNLVIIAVGTVILASSFFLIREQVAIGDEQFLHSMIPHHAGAVLMCEKADLTDSDIQELCANIVSSQRKEIEWMKTKLEMY